MQLHQPCVDEFGYGSPQWASQLDAPKSGSPKSLALHQATYVLWVSWSGEFIEAGSHYLTQVHH